MGDLLWFGRWSSYRPPILCRASQEAILRSSGHVLGLDCPSFPLESSKVGGTSRRKLAKIRPSEVVFSKFSRLSKSVIFVPFSNAIAVTAPV